MHRKDAGKASRDGDGKVRENLNEWKNISHEFHSRIRKGPSWRALFLGQPEIVEK
jgi:hypothetical protein